MNNNSLTHWGIKGMKWGVRRYQNKDGGLTPAGRKRYSQKGEDPKNDKTKKTNEIKKTKSATSTNTATAPERGTVKKNVKKMTETELKDRIARLELEKKVRDLEKGTTTRGRNFVLDVLEASGKNIATQATTHVMGIGVNKVVEKLFGDEFKDFVNPKKGQKDK